MKFALVNMRLLNDFFLFYATTNFSVELLVVLSGDFEKKKKKEFKRHNDLFCLCSF